MRHSGSKFQIDPESAIIWTFEILTVYTLKDFESFESRPIQKKG